MAIVVNNQETNEGDTVFYIDNEKQVHEAIVKDIVERDGLHCASLDVSGKTVKDVPHNTSPEKHSWNHPLNPEERKLHLKPDFYGPVEESENA